MSTRHRSGDVWIGVTAKHGSSQWTQENTCHYLNVLRAMGAMPLVLSPDAPTTLPDGTTYEPDDQGRLPTALLDQLDGLILAGGGDVHPRHFGEVVSGADPDSIDPKRDELELTLARQALAVDKPIFGICRGCQVLNVAAGGGMVQDLPGHRSSKEDPRLHAVSVPSGTLAQRVLGGAHLDVNTYHHQGVDGETLAPSLVPSALAQPDEWLLEAFEHPDRRWVLGVQWHPERLFELPTGHRLLWESFLDACSGGWMA